jgi:hypothetical protein
MTCPAGLLSSLALAGAWGVGSLARSPRLVLQWSLSPGPRFEADGASVFYCGGGGARGKVRAVRKPKPWALALLSVITRLSILVCLRRRLSPMMWV